MFIYGRAFCSVRFLCADFFLCKIGFSIFFWCCVHNRNPEFLFHFFCVGDTKGYSSGRRFLLFLYKSLNPSLPGTIWQMLLQSVQQTSLGSEMFSHMKGSLTNCCVLCWTTKRRGMLQCIWRLHTVSVLQQLSIGCRISTRILQHSKNLRLDSHCCQIKS